MRLKIVPAHIPASEEPPCLMIDHDLVVKALTEYLERQRQAYQIAKADSDFFRPEDFAVTDLAEAVTILEEW